MWNRQSTDLVTSVPVSTRHEFQPFGSPALDTPPILKTLVGGCCNNDGMLGSWLGGISAAI